MLPKKTPLLRKKGGKLKDPTPPVPRADQPIAAVPGTAAVSFPAMSPTPATILIAPAVDNTSILMNNITVVKSHHGNHAMNDNINISNESDDRGNWRC